jgi:DNA-binding NtrC family response regulator
MSSPTLLLVDDDPGVLTLLSQVGGRAGFDVTPFAEPLGALDAVRRVPPDVALVDLRLPRMGGLTVLTEIKRSAPACEVMLMSGYATVETAVEAVRLGARDCLVKPFDVPSLQSKLDGLRALVAARQVQMADQVAVREEATFEGMIGRSASMQALFDLIRRVAPHFTTALVTGETGTGKELVARALHRLSRRRDRPFLTVNCSAIVETLFESELFGHTRGAFTGALEARAGLFERAHGGVLFLDEIGELPPNMQAKLLRVLETGEVAKIGSRDTRRVDVHVVAATNRTLDREVREGRFRADLFYRLNAVDLPVPPLRERLEDVPLLARAFIERSARDFGRRVRGLTPAGAALLLGWHWPGNVRELRNVLERACMLAGSDAIDAGDLRLGPQAVAAVVDPAPRQVRRISDLEREEIERALTETSGNKKEAARRLGLSRRALYRRLDRFGLRSGGNLES